MAAKLIHEIVPVGLLQCNCSILGDRETREGIVVDPGDEVERILEIVRAHNLNIRAIVSTHTHIDHVGGLAKLHRATGAPVLIHEADLELYSHLDIQAKWLGVPTPEKTRIEDFLKEGDTLRWGGSTARVLHTPGHTPGSISLVVDPDDATVPPGGHDPKHGHEPHGLSHAHSLEAPRLIAGDTLFKGSIGRTDLWGGSLRQILDSIHEKLMTLPDEVMVFPGHGEQTTIGMERERNPFLH